MKSKYDDVDNSSYRIAHLVSQTSEGEYVVIVSPGESLEEQIRHGYGVNELFVLGDDFTTWPCDRELTA